MMSSSCGQCYLEQQEEVGSRDTSTMDPISEESLLSNLHKRFKRDQIYTYVGPILLSMNPFKKLSFYTPSIISLYQQHPNVFNLPPHIYALTEYVFKSMADKHEDQAIVITGEAASGKTEASKISLQYLVCGGGSSCSIETDFLKEQLINVNFILEAFGNAKTSQNDNSTRFAKFLEIVFDLTGNPAGGLINSYMLEKSRVSGQIEGDRNFHIFYQMLSGADIHLLKALRLQRNFEQYTALRSSEGLTEEMIDDKSNFLITKRAMEVIGLGVDEIDLVFRILASLIKLSNISFLPKTNIDGTEGSSIINEYELYGVCELLSIDFSRMQLALTSKSIESYHEIITCDASASEASRMKDVSCRALYSRLFTWMVRWMNECLKPKRSEKHCSIGILDLFGFEVLEENRYEQFLINYCNEKLHNVYIKAIFKERQEEYLREVIDWIPIDYFDNGVICDLLDMPNLGVMSILDEDRSRCKEPGDEIFLRRLIQNCHENPYFEVVHSCKSMTGTTSTCSCSSTSSSCIYSVPHTASHLSGHEMSSSLPSVRPSSALSSLPALHLLHSPCQTSRTSHQSQCFRIRHFAGTVTYIVTGFPEKNTERLCPLLTSVMYQSENELLRSLFPEGNPKLVISQQHKKPANLSSQYKIETAALVTNIQSRKLNFIKCIKPNEVNKPSVFEVGLVQHQIRYLLLTEASKLYRDGYAFGQSYESFLRRFKVLSSLTWPSWSGVPAEGVALLLKTMPFFPMELNFGRSKILIRSLKTVIDLEKMRSDKIHLQASLVQKTWRGWTAKKKYQDMKHSQRIIKNNWRFWKIRRFLRRLSRHLPSGSPLDQSWPESPLFLRNTNILLRSIHHRWRCRKYRLSLDQISRNRMREKLTASIIFKDRKVSYSKTVSHPFRGDYIRLRQNVKWKRIASEAGDEYVVFADIVNKVSRSSGKCVQKLLAISTSAMIVLDQRTLEVKYRIPILDIIKLSLSPYSDDMVFVHVIPSERSKGSGAFVFESGHVIELVTKMFLVIQNATTKIPEIEFATEFMVNFGREEVGVYFRCVGTPDHSSIVPARISKRCGRLDISCC